MAQEEVNVDPVPEEEEVQDSSQSVCLMLLPDGDGAEGEQFVKEVIFKRDERGEGAILVMPGACNLVTWHQAVQHGSIDDSAADLLGIHGERVRCFSLPGFERKMGLSLHMYIDLEGMEHKMPHNTNATQLFLIAHLPDEPPQVYPSSIHGPVLLSAENFKDESYVNLGLDHWAKIKSLCKAVQPNAQFVPYEPPSPDEEERELGDD